MDNPILGKVARVLDERSIAINVGAKDGVIVGMKFHVFDPGDDHGSYTIRDPDTNELLGSVRLDPKITVTVVEVQEMLSLALTQERRVNVGGANNFWGAMGPVALALMPPQWITKHDTLRRRESRSPKPLADSDSLVKEGDPVIQVATEVETTSEEVETEAVE